MDVFSSDCISFHGCIRRVGYKTVKQPFCQFASVDNCGTASTKLLQPKQHCPQKTLETVKLVIKLCILNFLSIWYKEARERENFLWFCAK